MTEPVFVLRCNELVYFCRNWKVSVDEDGMLLTGDFCLSIGSSETWHTAIRTPDYTVKLAGPIIQATLATAEDHRRIEQLAEHLFGLSEKFINSNLSHEFKEILKRTPTTLNKMSTIITNGVSSALAKLKQDK